MIRFLLLVLIVGIVQTAAAQDKPEPPSGQQPEIMLAQAMQKGDGVVVSFSSPVMKPISQTAEEEVDGKKVTIVRIVYEFVKWYETDVQVDGKSVRAYGIDGKEIAPKSLPERLKQKTRVAVVMLHAPVANVKLDSFYLQALREETVVFAIPVTTFYATLHRQ